MQKRSALRCCAALAITGAALGAGLGAAGATPTGPDQPTFGLRPALAGETTITKGHFSYASAAGTVVHDGVDVVNFTSAPLNIQLYRANLNPVPGGGLAPGQPADRPTGAAGWITITRADLVVPPRSDEVDAFRVSVPRYTPPGNYLASIVASSTGGTSAEGGLTIQSRVALTVEVTVVGKIRTALIVGSIHADRSGHTEHFTVEVTNRGNMLVTLSGRITVRAGGKPEVVPLGPDGIYAVPGGTARLSGRWSSLPLFGNAHLVGTVTALANDRPVGVYHSPTLQLWFVPWLDISLAAGTVVALAAAAFATRDRRARWWARRADERNVLRQYRANRASEQA